jgi:hypothetical protein
LNFTQIIKAGKKSIQIFFWIEVFIVSVFWTIGVEGIENKIIIIGLAIFIYYISIFWRDNKYVFWFMVISVILFILVLIFANNSKYKHKI